jgi:hypothetical protein
VPAAYVPTDGVAVRRDATVPMMATSWWPDFDRQLGRSSSGGSVSTVVDQSGRPFDPHPLEDCQPKMTTRI